MLLNRCSYQSTMFFIFALSCVFVMQGIAQHTATDRSITIQHSFPTCYEINKDLNISISVFDSELTTELENIVVIKKADETIFEESLSATGFSSISLQLQTSIQEDQGFQIQYYDSDAVLLAEKKVQVAAQRSISPVLQHLSCSSKPNGSISLDSNSSESFKWSTGQETSSISGLSAGQYAVTVTNDVGCERQYDFIIREDIVSEPVFHKISIECDGVIQDHLVASIDHSDGLLFDWRGDGLNEWTSNHSISMSSDRVYELEIQFTDDCTQSFSIDSKKLEPIEFKATPATIYPVDKINDSWFLFDLDNALDPKFGDLDNDKSLGSIFEVSYHNSFIEAELGINKLNTNFYSETKVIFARLQSATSCFDIAELSLEVAPKSEIHLQLIQNEACTNEANILLSGGTPEGGKYFISNCDNSENCSEDAIFFDEKSGDYYFNTSKGEGMYHVEYRYTNEAGVVNTAVDILTINTPNFDFFPRSTIVCDADQRIEIATVSDGQNITGVGVESESIKINGNTILTYFFNPEGLDEGSYSIYSEYVFNSKTTDYSCINTKTKVIEIFKSPKVDIVSANSEFCSGSDISISCNVQNGGANPSFEWFGPEDFYSTEQQLFLENASPLNSGIYYLEVTNTTGCTIQDFIDISVRDKMDVAISATTEVSCFGENDGAVEASVSNGSGEYTYLWESGATTAKLSKLSAGIHRLTVTDDLGCTIESSIGLFEPEQMQISIDVLTEIACFSASNGQLNMQVQGGTGPFEFVWDNGETTAIANNLSSGLHTVTVTDRNLCVREESIFLEQPDELLIDIININHLSCFGDSNGEAEIEVNGGTPPYDIRWANADKTLQTNSLTAGEHVVVVNDAIGCNTARVITIEEPKETIIEVADLQSHLCGAKASGKATLSIDGPSRYSVLWDNGEQGLTAESLTNGLHDVTITDGSNCEILFQLEVELTTNMHCEANQISPATCQSAANGVASVTGDGNSNITSYIWDNGETDAVAQSLTAGIHTVTLTDENGCSTSCTVTIDIAAPLQLACDNVINYSLPGNCQLNFTPKLVVENYTRHFEYSLSLTDEDGNEVDTFLIKNYVGQTLDYVITETCKRNSCWGKINLEDKLGPQLNCNTRTIDCIAHMNDFTDESIPLSGIEDHWHTDHTELEAKTIHDCSLIKMQYSDDVLEKSCDNPFSHIIKRNWTAIDEFNNRSSCTQQINIYREEVEVDWPVDTTYVYCMNASMDTELHPDMSPELLGQPYQKGMKHAKDLQSPCASLDYVFSDQLIQTCTGKYKLLREWIALQDCSDFRESYTQTIHVVTRTFDFIQQDTIVKIKSGFDCKTDMLLPIKSPNYCSKFTSYSARIYSEAEMEECVVYLEKPTTKSLAMDQNNVLIIPDLELGCNYIEVYLTTDCNDSDTLNFYATVIDRQAPVLICDAETVVSLGSNGIGFLTVANVDNGSWDNCGIDKIHLTKQDSICALDSLNIHEDKVSFCCEEAWTDVTVIMTVTDLSDNVSTCAINVTVEDNAFPHIDCPDNIALPCTVDISDLSITGSPMSEQLCTELTYFHIDSTEHHECKNQKLDRFWYTIIGRDTNFGCRQVIELYNENPFTEKNIQWPDDVELDGCEANLSAEYLGRPAIDTLDGCELIATNFIDKEFDESLGSCISILREWTIIDWCQFNEQEDGIWRNSQVIKVHDKVKPELICEDIEVCIEDRDCIGELDLLLSASDDCSATELLSFNYVIDIDSDGNSDYQFDNQSNRLLSDLPSGEHMLDIYVKDLCENISHCKSTIFVKDCTAPTPYCIAQTVSAIFNENDQSEVWANDFNLASRDNCSADESLIFSFEKDSHVLSKSFDCEDIIVNGSNLFELAIWVNDEAGNQDACYVTIRIDQNDNSPCDNINPGNSLTIAGTVNDVHNDALQDFEVQINQDSSPKGEVSMDASQAHFRMNKAEQYAHYEIKFTKEDNFNAGISTADMIALQNHLIGIHEIENEYLLLAADVNRDGRLSTTDLLLIKRLIIGQIESFPAYDSPWIFETTSQAVSKLSDVEFLTESLEEDLDLNFTAYKIGDVDGSSNKSNLSEFETRSDQINLNDHLAFGTSISPNPMTISSNLSFEVRNESQPISLTILSQTGQIIWREQRSYPLGMNELRLSESEHILSAGMYYIVIEQGQYRESVKLVKL